MLQIVLLLLTETSHKSKQEEKPRRSTVEQLAKEDQKDKRLSAARGSSVVRIKEPIQQPRPTEENHLHLSVLHRQLNQLMKGGRRSSIQKRLNWFEEKFLEVICLPVFSKILQNLHRLHQRKNSNGHCQQLLKQQNQHIGSRHQSLSHTNLLK